jgi:hypothetical protein
MTLTIKQPVLGNKGEVILKQVELDDVHVDQYCIVSIDGSTTNSGLAILRETDGAIMYIMSAKRDKDETPVQYKVRLKRAMKILLMKNKLINQVYYEEPVVANLSAVKNLFMLRAFIEELIVEEEPTFDYIQYYEVANTKWKSLFLAPDKVPAGTDNQKKAVRDKLERLLPFVSSVSQDEIDAICLGYVATQLLKKNISAGEELKSKKKPRAFKFTCDFVGSDSDDEALVEFSENFGGPKKLLERLEVCMTDLGNRESFDKHIYEAMGDDDKILIVKFPSKYHGDVVLKYKLGMLAQQFDYIYAAVWRNSRK